MKKLIGKAVRRGRASGYSLIEVLVGSAILLVSAYAVAYLIKGNQAAKSDSLKACQDINEEVFAQINSLGQGDFSYTYGTGSVNNPNRHCPSGVCQNAELAMNPSQRWPSSLPLTTRRSTSSTEPPSVRPHLLRLSAINYLAMMYNSAPCAVRDMPASDIDVLSGDGTNLLHERQRAGRTQIRVQPLNIQGQPVCPPPPLQIRPPSGLSGHQTPVLASNLINSATAARSDLTLRVELISHYTDSDGSAQSCTSEKVFAYQPESYRGQLQINHVTPPPSFSITPLSLPLCSAPSPTVGFRTRVAKAERDSVLLCRDRSQVGSWMMGSVPCDPGNPSGSQCTCSLSNGCPNTWATFPPMPPASLTAPHDRWFPCDQLPEYLSSSGS